MVKDIEKSKQFYHDLFGLDLLLDNDGNMILTEGLVLQDEKIWKNFFLGGEDFLVRTVRMHARRTCHKNTAARFFPCGGTFVMNYFTLTVFLFPVME